MPKPKITELDLRLAVDKLRSDGKTYCDVDGCDTLAVCLVGCGQGHPSCAAHARGASYISPLDDAWDENLMERIESLTTEELEEELQTAGISIEPRPEIKARLEAAREQLRRHLEEGGVTN